MAAPDPTTIATAFQSTESQKEKGKACSSLSGHSTWFTLYLLRLQWPKPSHGLNWLLENVTCVLFSHEFNHTSVDLLPEEAEESEYWE